MVLQPPAGLGRVKSQGLLQKIHSDRCSGLGGASLFVSGCGAKCVGLYAALWAKNCSTVILIVPLTDSMTNHLHTTGLTFPICEKLTNSFVFQTDSIKISQ